MAMPGRTYASTIGGYRYAHNGQEKDGEIFDGALSAEFWEYDSRLGRRWEVDPIIKEWESPYATFGNNPIYYNDVKGLDKGDKNKSSQPKFGKKHTKKEQRKINRAHRKHERWTRRRERKARNKEGRDSNPLDAPAFSIHYSNTPGRNPHTPPIINVFGEKKDYYNSTYIQEHTNPNGTISKVLRVDEPNNIIDARWRLMDHWQGVLYGAKQKFRPKNGLHWEAPTAIEIGCAYMKRYVFGSKQRFTIGLSLAGTAGTTLSSLVFDDKSIKNNSYSIGFPGQDQYSAAAINSTLIARVDFVYLRIVTFSIMANYHHVYGIDVKTSNGNKNIGNYGSASATLMVGFLIGNR